MKDRKRDGKFIRIACSVLLVLQLTISAVQPVTAAENESGTPGRLEASGEQAELEEAEETIILTDEPVPLADIVIEDETPNLAVWWLILLGTVTMAGYELYRLYVSRESETMEEQEIK